MSSEMFLYKSFKIDKYDHVTPVSESEPFKDLNKFLTKLNKIQELLDYNDLSKIKTRSNICCICEKDIGNMDYKLVVKDIEFQWANDIAHYFSEHNIHPSKEFYCIIMSYSIADATKPDYKIMRSKANKRDRQLEYDLKY